MSLRDGANPRLTPLPIMQAADVMEIKDVEYLRHAVPRVLTRLTWGYKGVCNSPPCLFVYVRPDHTSQQAVTDGNGRRKNKGIDERRANNAEREERGNKRKERKGE